MSYAQGFSIQQNHTYAQLLSQAGPFKHLWVTLNGQSQDALLHGYTFQESGRFTC